jgi:DNA-binding MarR family transcriptional regulator
MIRSQLQDQLSLLLIRSSMKNKYAVLKIAEDNNITLMPALTLCLLTPHESVPMKYLSTFMSCDPSNITGIIEHLVIEKLVERKEATHDRRIKTVTLTDTGLALRDKFLSVTTAARLPSFDSLNDEELQQLVAILEKATTTSSQ